jgi:diketogulonate reductase-like aldo/keto reductase
MAPDACPGTHYAAMSSRTAEAINPAPHPGPSAVNPMLNNPVVIQTAARLGVAPSQIVLQWLLCAGLSKMVDCCTRSRVYNNPR